MLGHVNHVVGIEVEAGHGVIRLGLGWLLLDAGGVAMLIESHNTEAVGILDGMGKDSGRVLCFGACHSRLEHGGEALAVEDVVAQHQASSVIADKLLADDEGLCQALGTGLLGIAELYAQLVACTQQSLEHGQVVRGGDNQYLADAGKHQHRDGVVNHRFVIDGNQLLGDSLGDGVQARS